MAANNAIILSSSPVRPFATLTMPSSSPLPSPSQVFQRKPTLLRSGSGVASIPTTAAATFTTASALLKQIQIEPPSRTDTLGIAETDPHAEGEGGENAQSRVKTIMSVKEVKDKVVKEKVTRKRQPKLAGPVEEGAVKPSKKPRKASIKKSTTVDQGEDNRNGIRSSRAGSGETGEGQLDSAIVVKAKKPRAKKSKAKDGQNLEEPSRQEAADKKPKGTSTAADGGIKPKPLRKPRAKKPIDTSQALLSKEKITKPITQNKSMSTMDPSVRPQDDDIDIGVVQAVRRRTDWTPPVTVINATLVSPAPALVLDSMLDASGMSSASKPIKGFDDLFGSFGFVNSSTKLQDATKKMSNSQEQAIVRKRKLIELVRTTSSDKGSSPVKKPVKKKPLTITERATAAYAEVDMDDVPLMQYFSPHISEHIGTSNMKSSAKRRTKSRVKGSKQAPILLSPETAIKQVANQDFVFGTSSQLAREESPTLLRDIHEAIQASLAQNEQINGAAEQRHTMEGRLWAAAARTKDGYLVEKPQIENSLSAKPMLAKDDFVDLHTLLQDVSEAPTQAKIPHTLREASRLVEENNEAISSRPLILSEPASLSNAIAEEDDAAPPSAQRQSPSRSREVMPETETVKSASQSHKTAKLSPAKAKPVKPTKKSAAKSKVDKQTGLQMPKFETYTSSQLAKEIASYHFKPVKNRDAMITLLETCWKAKHESALKSANVNSQPKSVSKTATAFQTIELSPAKKPRGRPKKDTTVSPAGKLKPGRPPKAKTSPAKAEVLKISTPRKSRESKDSQEEIDDSDVQLTPSPPRRHPSQAGKPPLPLDLSIDSVEASPELSASQQQAEVFEHITKSITSAPRATDNKNPSWHEKILLYDPIILEDLTVWLNAGNLGRVGWDGEVAPAEVKKWCESNSICCLWKENLRGGNRSRY